MNERSSPSKAKARCNMCGTRLKKGGTRYRINLEIISDFEGRIEDSSKKPEDYLKGKIEKILDETREMTEEELQEEVYLKRNWLACVNCRSRLMSFLKEISG
jgi:hypothetical protein